MTRTSDPEAVLLNYKQAQDPDKGNTFGLVAASVSLAFFILCQYLSRRICKLWCAQQSFSFHV